MKVNLSGLGAYPGQAYFDQDRPSWLPYWLDTPTESELKYHADSILQATANAAGMAAGEVLKAGTSGAAQALKGAGGGLFASLFENPDGSLDWATIGVVAGAAAITIYVATRR